MIKLLHSFVQEGAESAAFSEELSGQAAALKELATRFQLKG